MLTLRFHWHSPLGRWSWVSLTDRLNSGWPMCCEQSHSWLHHFPPLRLLQTQDKPLHIGARVILIPPRAWWNDQKHPAERRTLKDRWWYPYPIRSLYYMFSISEAAVYTWLEGVDSSSCKSSMTAEKRDRAAPSSGFAQQRTKHDKRMLCRLCHQTNPQPSPLFSTPKTIIWWRETLFALYKVGLLRI